MVYFLYPSTKEEEEVIEPISPGCVGYFITTLYTYEISSQYKAKRLFRCDISLKGDMNSFRLYIYVGVQEKKIYDLSDIKKSPINIPGPSIDVGGSSSLCFFLSDYEFLCSSGNNLIKYTIDSKLEEINYSEFLSSDTAIASFLVTDDSQVIVAVDTPPTGSNNNSIYIYDSSAHLLKTMNIFNGEVALGSNCLLAKLNSENIIVITQYHDHEYYYILEGETVHKMAIDINNKIYAVQILKMGEYFALAGNKQNAIFSEIGGLVIIAKVNADFTFEIYKERINIGSSANCYISFISEIEDGIIYFAGNADCKVGCSWDYMVDSEPICYPLDDDYDYSNGGKNIVKVCT